MSSAWIELIGLVIALSSTWSALIGVVVGGVISTGWAWGAVVRQELSQGMVAARLVDEDLDSIQQGRATADPDGETWTKNREALARVLGHSQWEKVANVYRHPAANSNEMKDARKALKAAVRGKRFLVLERLGNWRADRRDKSTS